jgi:hypothetical protein
MRAAVCTVRAGRIRLAFCLEHYREFKSTPRTEADDVALSTAALRSILAGDDARAKAFRAAKKDFGKAGK